ncbi:hypothetical protein H7849_04335 [Alloacidobacterium dinghuense]|uniref:DUF5666 domain-containing protein n=1 Tax=Alloacidobacterium dinghuense TaxID=2763107 RepID=A0A7G8BKY4_9BACT|nr:hypothetical protein [Alloacidobacterium dinghuense]QNI33204.1 hypothetical protein H7849_04335 [Alloacidobacterium dinghuense]
MGGAIHNVDPVRDQLTLNVSGGKQRVKILFDERTQVYRDGVRVKLGDLRPDDHASIETVLDGTSVFALSIHMLSQSPEGECEGQVLNYDAGSGELTVNDVLSREPVKLRVPAKVAVTREGQAATSSSGTGLAKGTLISVKFQSDNQGHGIANQIAVLATPGSSFVFSGNVAFLDLHSNLLVVVDPRDEKSYKISFDPARFPASKDLHEGANVSVTASFDGTHYVASAIIPRQGR